MAASRDIKKISEDFKRLEQLEEKLIRENISENEIENKLSEYIKQINQRYAYVAVAAGISL